MGGLVIKLRQWWDTADRAQRTVTIGGGAFLALMVAVTVMFATRPHLTPAFIGLNAVDQASVVAELQKDGFSPEVDERGDVLVPSDKVQDARIKLAAAGKLPATSGFGDEALAKLGVFDTPDVEKERLKTILEGRLDETIQSVDGIGSAQVHIVLADKSSFVRDKKPATASVCISEQAGSSIGKAQAQAIATLVANSTPDLSINNVSVVNNRMEMLWDGTQMDTSEGAINAKLDAEVSEARRREAELQALLDPAFGPQAVIAKVNLELDFDDKVTDTNTYDPVKIQSAKTTESMGEGATPPAGAAPITPGSGKYTMDQSKFDTYANQTTQHIKPVGGTLKSMAIDVIVDSQKVTNPDDVQKIVDGYLGSKKGQPGFTSTVTPVKFDTTAAAAAKKAQDSVGSQQRMQQIISMLPVAALLIVGFLVMKSVGKMSRMTTMALPGGGTLAINTGPAALPASAAEAIRMAERAPNDANLQQLAKQMTDAGLSEDEAEAQIAAIKGISRKVNVPLEQIRKMSSDRPETVAMLIKGWLLEER
ncbi:MAG: flagellar basal-body MS-ring/collar protein FliF [Fimbriimonadaceae bacterium]